MDNTPDSPAKSPVGHTTQGGNFWTLITPEIWKVLHAVLPHQEDASHARFAMNSPRLAHETLPPPPRPSTASDASPHPWGEGELSPQNQKNGLRSAKGAQVKICATFSLDEFLTKLSPFFALQLTGCFKSVECAPLLQRTVFSAVEGESGFSEINGAELDEAEEMVHNLSSVLQTGFRVWRSEADL